MKAEWIRQCTSWIGCERVGGAEHLGAVGRERDVDRSGVLLVDGREAVGVKAPPQPIVGPRESPLRVGEPPGRLGVAAELTLELRGERACRFGYRRGSSGACVSLGQRQPCSP